MWLDGIDDDDDLKPFGFVKAGQVGGHDKLAKVASVSKGGRGKEGGLRVESHDIGVDKDAARRAQKTTNLASEAKKAAVDLGLDNNQSALLAAPAFSEIGITLREIHEAPGTKIKCRVAVIPRDLLN